MATVGLLHPGEMGAAIGRVLRDRGHDVVWASPERSKATSQRAAAAGLTDVLSVEALGEQSDVILSVCPPHAAMEVARATLASPALLVDANAIAPATARAIAAERDRSGLVDGGIIGPTPEASGTKRHYHEGTRACIDARVHAVRPTMSRVLAQ